MRERLRALPVFADLDDDQLDRLAGAAAEFDAAAGQLLIERGAPGAGMFVLETGQAVVETPEGERELGPGDIFGERALIEDEQRRTARVRARTDVRCLAIQRAEIDRLAVETPRFAERLRQFAGERT